MVVSITEFRKLLEVGRSYLDGTGTFAELYHGAKMTAHAAHFWGISSSPLMQIIPEWEHRATRCWRDIGEQRSSDSDARFDEWLREQLYFPDRDIYCHATPCSSQMLPPPSLRLVSKSCNT